jgi:hypothetical protein
MLLVGKICRLSWAFERRLRVVLLVRLEQSRPLGWLGPSHDLLFTARSIKVVRLLAVRVTDVLRIVLPCLRLKVRVFRWKWSPPLASLLTIAYLLDILLLRLLINNDVSTLNCAIAYSKVELKHVLDLLAAELILLCHHVCTWTVLFGSCASTVHSCSEAWWFRIKNFFRRLSIYLRSVRWFDISRRATVRLTVNYHVVSPHFVTVIGQRPIGLQLEVVSIF